MITQGEWGRTASFPFRILRNLIIRMLLLLLHVLVVLVVSPRVSKYSWHVSELFSPDIPSNMFLFCSPSWKHLAPNPNAPKPSTLLSSDMVVLVWVK